jgi:hypothetical protein
MELSKYGPPNPDFLGGWGISEAKTFFKFQI